MTIKHLCSFLILLFSVFFVKGVSMSDGVFFRVRMRAVEGKEQALVQVIDELSQAAKKLSPGVISYFLTQDRNDKRYFELTEIYPDGPSFRNYFNSPEIVALFERLVACEDQQYPVEFYCYGCPDEETRKCLDTLGFVYIKPVAGFLLRSSG
ncbi:hypothetical protein HN446_00040 [bacterium]|nr:hypothetical protein [bacterium]